MSDISIHNAKVHNLKGIDVTIPRDSLTVVTGLSGSGKSSLAFDTLYAEGQRRYVESLSAYARQFLDRMQKPDVEKIEGLSPAISIEQRTTSGNPRSIVATVTEIHDYLRILYGSIAVAHCPHCGKPVVKQSAEQIVEAIIGRRGTYPPSEASAEGGSMRGGNGERELREALAEIEHLHVSTCSTRLKSLNPLASLYARFTEKQHAAEIARLLTPPGMKAEVVVVYQTIEDLHKSLAPVPGSRFPVPRIGDWYFTGDYPTPGGYKVLRKALLNYWAKNSDRSD